VCNFLSVLILRNGDIRHHPMLDSHSDLVTYFKLPDTDAYVSHFAKAELTPVDWTDASTWKWRIDEDVRPIWLDEVEAAAESATRSVAQRMVLKDVEHTLIVDGCWIVAGSSKVRDVRSGRILRVQDSATVRDVRDSATVQNVGGSATVRDVWGSATVRGVWGSATVQNVGDSATVQNVWGSATLDASAKAHLKVGE